MDNLKEWIPTFEKLDQDEWNKNWSKVMEDNVCLKYCRDLCNISKHMTSTKASITANIVITRNYEEDGSELGEFTGWTLHIDDKKLDLYKLMDQCTEA